MTFEEWLGNQIDERTEVYAEIGQECYDNGYQQGRCDAIEELVKLIENEMPYDICDGNEAIEEIKKIAELLKEQKE